MANGTLTLFNSLLPASAKETIDARSDRFYNFNNDPIANPVWWGLPSYFNGSVSDGGLLDGKYDIWCVNTAFSISRGSTYDVAVYSSYDVVPVGVLPAGQVDANSDGYLDSLQAINWVFNNILEPGNVVLEPLPSVAYTNTYSYDIDGVAGNETFTSGDVQWAIWKLLGANVSASDQASLISHDVSGVTAEKIALLASTLGSTFVPVAGQDIGVILSPGGANPSAQPTIIEVKTAGLGDTVFADCNDNGQYDPGEGLGGVRVKLLADTNGDTVFEVVATAVTGDNPDTAEIETGYYSFGPLLAGPTYDSTGAPGPGVVYRVMVDTSTLPGVGWTNTVDPDGANDSMSSVTLKPGEVNLGQDFGYALNEVCDTFTFNGSDPINGTAGNSLTYATVSGVSVTATAWSRVQSNGNWDQAYLGAYGGGLGVTDTGEDGTGDSHTVDNIGGRDNYVVFQFSQDVVVDRAFLGHVVGDSDISVWIGSSPQPITSLSDALLAGMSLYEEDWTSSGSPRWADFNAGEVGGNVLIIAANTSDSTPEDRFKIEKLDFCTADVCKASIGDRVWLDCDNDGIQDVGEAGVAGVTVKLLNSAGAVLDTTVTNASGYYLFSALTPGDYAVQVVAPTGFSFAKQNQGSDDNKDSDVDSSGRTIVTTLTPGEYDTSWDAGLVPTPVCVTYDFSGSSGTSGLQGNSRVYTDVASGLTVTATAWSRVRDGGDTWDAAYLGAYEGGHGVTDSSEGDGSGNRHTVDNVGGRDNFVVYQFSQEVVVDRAYLGYVVDDSDISVWVGTINGPISMSNAVLASMALSEEDWIGHGDPRWADFNAGEVSGNVLIIAASTVDSTPEDEFKIEKLDVCTVPVCEPLPTKASIGDTVWLDSDGDGVQDADEAGVSGVTVKLLNGAGTEVASTTTDSDGKYLFSDLDPGDYAIKVIKPDGYNFTGQDQGGNDDTDSDVNTGSGQSVVTTLSAGENDLSWDAGLVTLTPVCLTYDFSGNSATDGSDGNSRSYTVSGVTVTATAWSRVQSTTNSDSWSKAYLGAYGGGHGVTDDSEGSGSGDRHTVDNLGGRDNYVVYQFSQNVVVDRAFLGYVVGDSDISVWIGSSANPITNVNNALLASMTLYEENWVSHGSARWADFNAGNVSGNVLIIAANTSDSTPEDRFKIQKLDVCTTPVGGTGPQKASIGNQVWCDTNGNGLQDADEAGVAGVTVKLLDAGGAFLASTTTDGDGQYRFTNLNPGDYKLQFVKPSAFGGFTIADKDGNSQDTLDSDADSAGMTAVTTLVAGENDTSWDAGLTPPRVDITYDFSGSSATDGSDGNVRSYTVDGITVTARAVSRHVDSSNNVKWETAWLGAYGGGHGVTDRGEGSGSSNSTHTVDNVGRVNYVIYQFSEKVVVDKAFLGYVIGDSDLTAWIGSSATTLGNLSDTLLAGMSKEDNNTTSSSTRWADINGSNKEGNVLVIAASTSDSTPDDFFKIKKLAISAASKTVTPIAIDLDGNGIQTTALADAQGDFDLLGSGGAVRSGWLSAGDAFLAFDADGNGRIDSIAELFGGSRQGDGFARLAAFDSNGDGRVDAADDAFGELSVWRDANGNHRTDAGELISLADAGVASLSLGYRNDAAFWDNSGNLHLEQSTATLSDGSVVDMTDVYFSATADDAAMAAIATDPGWLFA